MEHSTPTPHFPDNLQDYAPWVAKHGLLYPYGECQCGCGQKTTIARQRVKSARVNKGQPYRFFAKHNGGKPPREKTFWARVNRPSLRACWEWQGGKTEDGYGSSGYKGKSVLSHRLAWELTNGPIPKGLQVLHKCDNPPCCNPSHLFLGTQSDNMKDMFAKKRKRTDGEHNSNAKLTSQQVTEIRWRFAQGGIQRQELAIEYEVSSATIGQLLRRKTWTHIP